LGQYRWPKCCVAKPVAFGLQKEAALFKNGTRSWVKTPPNPHNFANLDEILRKNEMTDADQPISALPSQPLRSALVSGRKVMRFNFIPTAPERAAMAKELDLIDLPEFTYKGELSPAGRSDVILRADLTALVVQPCSVSLAPVRSRLTDSTERRYIQDYKEPDADEMEISEEDTEALPETIDIAAIALEALALALPLYPRARGAEFGEAVFAAPGVTPIKSDDLRPFAGLAGLADKLKKPDEPQV
jgi:uncharacterized metal-binding protein YceD (DUF177 family)